jgi:branched-chain amino acid transport system ATP-binding protein
VFGPLSVADNLRLGAYRRGGGGRQTARDLDRVYAMFPALAERREAPAGGLSGGQQQMLAIGRALMGRPRLLLLDEPSMGLAPILVAQIFEAIADLSRGGVTLILVEQNAFAALSVAGRGYVLETGHITKSASGRALLGDKSVREAYLGI